MSLETALDAYRAVVAANAETHMRDEQLQSCASRRTENEAEDAARAAVLGAAAGRRYLVVYGGYEGVEEISGVYDAEEAVAVVRERRAVASVQQAKRAAYRELEAAAIERRYPPTHESLPLTQGQKLANASADPRFAAGELPAEAHGLSQEVVELKPPAVSQDRWTTRDDPEVAAFRRANPDLYGPGPADPDRVCALVVDVVPERTRCACASLWVPHE